MQGKKCLPVSPRLEKHFTDTAFVHRAEPFVRAKWGWGEGMESIFQLMESFQGFISVNPKRLRAGPGDNGQDGSLNLGVGGR